MIEEHWRNTIEEGDVSFIMRSLPSLQGIRQVPPVIRLFHISVFDTRVTFVPERVVDEKVAFLILRMYINSVSIRASCYHDSAGRAECYFSSSPDLHA